MSELRGNAEQKGFCKTVCWKIKVFILNDIGTKQFFLRLQNGCHCFASAFFYFAASECDQEIRQ